jgi:hypothetical protein
MRPERDEAIMQMRRNASMSCIAPSRIPSLTRSCRKRKGDVPSSLGALRDEGLGELLHKLLLRRIL